MRRLRTAAPAVFVLGLVLARGPIGVAAPPVDFNRDVRPILSEACFHCHGPDKAERKADLRLDTREGALAAVIVPGQPDESELVARIVSNDPEEVMPPPRSGKALTPAQVATLRRWVEQGAEWKGHWAYIPPTRPAVPQPDPRGPAGFVRNDVDRFVLARLAEHGLEPSPEADRATLARRLTFDLTGLPPTPAEVDAFIDDHAPDAYEQLVERTLASPHHGERLAGSWLDLVRYADTTGYHGDNHRDVALYRDWVVDAFNRNARFDAFTVDQLAGDLVPNPSPSQRIASGYNKMLMTTQEGGAQAKEYTAKYAADRVRNASAVWMGATLGCAECHDHKFDPFTTRDFYRFAAFFADIQEAAVGAQETTRFPTPEQARRLSQVDARVATLQKTLDTPTPELLAAQAEWERSASAPAAGWTVLAPESAVSRGGATLTVRPDGSILASGASPERDVYTLTFKAPKPNLTALKLDLVPDGKLPGLGPGRADNGNVVLNEIAVATDGKEGARVVAWSDASSTFAQGGFAVAGAIDGKTETGWAVGGETGRPNAAVFQAKDDFGPCCEECGLVTLTVTLRFDHGDRHTLGRFRLSATDAPRPVRAGGLPSKVAELLAVPAKDRTDSQKAELAAHYRAIAPALQPARDALAAARRERTEIEAATPATVVTRAGAPRTMRILPRGNWLDDSGPVVTPAVPAFLKAPSETPGAPRASRLDLARWIVSRENPLTARVFVNRLWVLAFGRGIVATPDDFGAQGAWPTHPELLDWLAEEFVASGWDVRHVLRLIVTSGTYRQSSHASESLLQRDPYNQWLARQGRFRLDAEAVRDNALAVSGLLVRQIGGPPARPYQPAGYWSHLNFPKREYQPDHGVGLYRRGLYTYWCRTFLHPSLLAFDAPTREECTVQRPRSNTPLQALVLLNDPTYVEAARALAERALREGGRGTPDRVAWIFRDVLARRPTAAEAKVLEALVDRHRAGYRADPASAAALIQTGERPAPADLAPAELAAWTSVARVVLNLHETITRY